MTRNSFHRFAATLLAVSALLLCSVGQAQDKRPNILVLWGDDIGYWNLSAYNQGMMGYKTPNIDRIAKEGALFTDWYGQQSCTAGRAAFVTGQSPFRTGLLKVGLPGAKEGLQARDVTIADLLKAQGYMTGQFGKNHLGDLDEHLPTAHGFHEFMGSLYHLNAEDEPEHEDYFKSPEMRKKYGTRGVIHTWANADGTQRIESTGALNKKRMETIDDEVTKETIRFMADAKKAGKPFFLWWNATRMHIWTRLKESARGKTGFGIYPDGMVEHDAHVGQLLDALKELGLDQNTIVMYSTDNGAEKFTWPDGGTSPFRGEKNTNWEGGYRVPTAIRWPGVVKPGTVLNDIFAHEDMLPTLLAAAGVPNVKEQLKEGLKVGNKTFKVHLDGYNVTDALAGKGPSPRHEFFYFNDDGSVVGLRFDQWKIVFAEQKAHGAAVWREPFTTLRAPKIFNLRSDPVRDRETRKPWTGTAGGSSTSSCSCPPSNSSGSSSVRSRSFRPASGWVLSPSTTYYGRCNRRVAATEGQGSASPLEGRVLKWSLEGDARNESLRSLSVGLTAWVLGLAIALVHVDAAVASGVVESGSQIRPE